MVEGCVFAGAAAVGRRFGRVGGTFEALLDGVDVTFLVGVVGVVLGAVVDDGVDG